MNNSQTMPVSAWRMRLILYLCWVGGGSALAGIDSLDGTWRSSVKFALGLLISIVGAWRTFLDRSTPEKDSRNP